MPGNDGRNAAPSVKDDSERQPAAGALLTGLWYLAMPGKQLARSKLAGKLVLGEPVVFGRAADGAPFALRDICPHRGMPLRYGTLSGRDLTCCYHGWRFGLDGTCVEIPACVDGDARDPSRIRVRSYPCREVQGNVWIFMTGRRRDDGEPLPEVPRLPDIGDASPQVAISMRFPCHADHAALGLVDPAHVPFVHTSRWWSRKRDLRLKEKTFEPTPLGFRMQRHPLPPESRVYKLLGENVTSEITFDLPGVRVEHVRGDKHTAVNLTAVTPVNGEESEVHQCLYWTIPWLAPFRPVARYLSRVFLGQDRDFAVRLHDGLVHNPPRMFVGDPDAQAKWYLRLKREWLRAQAEGREFKNPVNPTTLRWRT